MGLVRNAGEEFSEEILYGTAYAFIFPQVRAWVDAKFPDEVDPDTKRTKPNILKEAVESSINVLMMGVMFMIIRYQEALLEKIFAAAHASYIAIMAGGKNFLTNFRNKLKGRKGVNVMKRFERVGGSAMDSRVALARHVQGEAANIIQAHQSQYQAMASYAPAATMQDTAVQKERLYQELGASKVNAKLQLSMFKLFSAGFTPADKETLKVIYKSIDPSGTFDPNKVDVDKLNKISSFMFSTDDSGKIIGLSEAFLELINGLGYLHKSNSGAV